MLLRTPFSHEISPGSSTTPPGFFLHSFDILQYSIDSMRRYCCRHLFLAVAVMVGIVAIGSRAKIEEYVAEFKTLDFEDRKFMLELFDDDEEREKLLQEMRNDDLSEAAIEEIEDRFHLFHHSESSVGPMNRGEARRSNYPSFTIASPPPQQQRVRHHRDPIRPPSSRVNAGRHPVNSNPAANKKSTAPEQPTTIFGRIAMNVMLIITFLLLFVGE